MFDRIKTSGILSAGTIAVGIATVTMFGSAADAATVVPDGTNTSGSFTIQGGGTVVGVSDPAGAWDLAPTSPASEWIWDQAKVTADTFLGPVTFLYSFSMAGFDATTATLSGLIGQDDIGSIKLNGTDIFSTSSGNNWATLVNYGTIDSSLFNSGDNVLSFFVENTGAHPAGLRATVTVEASVVPLPAAGFLLLGAIGGLAAFRRRKTIAG